MQNSKCRMQNYGEAPLPNIISFATLGLYSNLVERINAFTTLRYALCNKKRTVARPLLNQYLSLQDMPELK